MYLLLLVCREIILVGGNDSNVCSTFQGKEKIDLSFHFAEQSIFGERCNGEHIKLRIQILLPVRLRVQTL